jgi:flagellar biosynthetic protein FliQ
MTDTDIAALIRTAMLVTLKLGGPPLIVGLLVGLVISFVQAVTQINEATLAFLPKVAAICLAMILLGPFMAGTLVTFSQEIFQRIVLVGGL